MLINRFFLALILCTSTLFSSAQAVSSTPSVKVMGEVKKPLNLSMQDLIKMKTVITKMKEKGGAEHEYNGVALQEILSAAGVTTGAQLRGENLSKYLLVKCADGYEVLFSLAELDSSFTDRVVTLVYQSDGKPLSAATGPFRLVVPGEKKPARSCRQVVEMVVKFAKE